MRGSKTTMLFITKAVFFPLFILIKRVSPLFATAVMALLAGKGEEEEEEEDA